MRSAGAILGGMTATDHTFVFADLAGYTAMTEAHGDDDAAKIALEFHELAQRCLPAGARIVKTIGDAVMLVAPTIEDGVRVALVLASDIAARRHFPAVRIGIHAGPAAARDGDFFGAAVNLAARVAGVARAGEIVCTEPVAAAALGAQLSSARPMGTVRLKNVAAPVALYELATGAAAGALHHLDPVCRMQIAAEAAPTTVVHDGVTLYFCSSGCAARFEATPQLYLLDRAE